MGEYLIDSNVISAYFSGYISEKAIDFIAEVIDQIPIISVSTEIEALSWINSDKNKESIVQEFIKDVTVVPLTPSIVKKCVAIRRSR